MIGKTLGHYEITDKPGQGGMGSVWLAQDANLSRFTYRHQSSKTSICAAAARALPSML